VSDFTSDEQRALAPYFSNLTGPVFALTNLPETVKGALFARYSRSAKSLRRLFLDEFLGNLQSTAAPESHVGVERAEKLYARVFSDYGDDSVAQLGGVHLACEGVSNILTKVIEWGRLMAYLEQSTRYVPYTDRPGGMWKYCIPGELDGTPLHARFKTTLDRTFETYARWIEPMQEHFRVRFPKDPADSDGVYRAAIRAKALDTLRGLLQHAEDRAAAEFGAAGRSFLGAARVLAQKPEARPAPGEPRRALSPRVACRNKWKRIEALLRLAEFRRAYRDALEDWRAGMRDAVFPPGTWLMRVQHQVRCAAPS